MLPNVPRRHLILATIAALGGVALGAKHTLVNRPQGEVGQVPPPGQVPETASNTLPYRPLGRTQVSLPVLGLGGSASPLSRPNEEAIAIAIIERAFALGIRFFDTAANYGPSEGFLGKVLHPYRQQVFLATKTNVRDRDGAWRDLENSLQRLRTDYIDLWQFHALAHDWDLDTILDERNGAIVAYEEAKSQGVVRFGGVTGHYNPGIIARALQSYPFHTALIPVNAADIHTPEPFIRGVLPIAQQHNVGIIAMKVPAYGRLLKVLKNMDTVFAYALSQPGVHTSIIAANTLDQLEENVRAAQRLRVLQTQEMRQIEQQTRPVWQESSFFRAWG